MELRHLDTVLAIAEQGSFTAAADALNTVQSNVSEQVRQLEKELGVELLTRTRRGAIPTEFGERVIERARRVRRELEALRVDLSMLQGLEVGESSFGTVGTASRWIVPRLVAELRRRAPGIRLRVNEAASERLAAEVLGGELAQAIVTEPVHERRLVAETLLEEALVAVVPADAPVGEGPVLLEDLAPYGLVLPPASNPLRTEVDHAAARVGLTLPVTVEVEGIRLIGDLVAAGAGASVLPETAVPTELAGVRTVGLAGVPPRRLALISARDSALSLADRAVRDSVRRLVAERPVAIRPILSASTPLETTGHYAQPEGPP